MRQHGFLRQGFPWAWFSLWRENYSDGAPLFHIFLIPFSFGDLVFGGKLAGVLLSAFALSSFYAILALHQVRWRLYWFWLLLMGGGLFWWRLLDLRPQVLSCALLLWSLHFLLRGRLRAFAVLSFFYPLSYVAGFLPQVLAAVRWAYMRATGRRGAGRMLAAGLAACALAALLHPYFPKNLRFFYVQNLYVMWLAVTQSVPLHLGGEFFPMDTRELVCAHLPLLLHLAALAFIFMHRRPPLSEDTRTMFPFLLVLLALGAASKRFVEYAVPAATLFCAFLGSDVLAGWSLADIPARRRRSAVYAWIAAVVLATGVEAAVVRSMLAGVRPPRFAALAQVLRERVPAGAMVYTCDWDETPELFFFDERLRYPVMMDPTFMYYWDPGVWKKWNAVANGELSPDETVRVLKETFGARYGLCGSKFHPLRVLIAHDLRFQLLAEDRNGFVFALP